MRSSLLLLLAFLAGCNVRGTGPNSIEVGAACDPTNDSSSCEETCLRGPQMCVFACATDSECPAGSACTILTFQDSPSSHICLPLCATVPCEAYSQGLCCTSMLRSSGAGTVNVCHTSTAACRTT